MGCVVIHSAHLWKAAVCRYSRVDPLVTLNGFHRRVKAGFRRQLGLSHLAETDCVQLGGTAHETAGVRKIGSRGLYTLPRHVIYVSILLEILLIPAVCHFRNTLASRASLDFRRNL